ncbi:LysM peptidoglycan-binding domain-containing protein [Heyndrickxia sp. MSNUG]|uniref:LysM peptidoglycan-binding domain-containing protein n=1 Tax=Heyndrickxia sp. MSNUG TaxID=3136677 RepID=UPI003C2EC646
MNREKPIRDQAERLRKRVERKAEQAVDKKETLPPRSELHRQKQKKTKVKVKYPVIRLMALFFILLPITFFSIISYLDGSKGPLDITKERAGVELIDVESGSGGGSEAKDSSDDEDSPSIEEIAEPEDIGVAAAPAPESGNDKNTPGNAVSTKEQTAASETTTKQPAAEAPQAPPANAGGEEKIIYHTVQPSETLFRVAMKYYKSQEGIPIIKNANNIQGNEIKAGQVLKIPIKN